jgi:NADPH-dependent 2,4-dienoyl-CoA reductase/sulfur reductase-like enzyme
MISRDYLIIGAGLAGARACEGIRAHDRKGSVTLAGREAFLPYHRPPLSKDFLKSQKADPAKLACLPAAWFEKNKIELRLDTLVTQVNMERHLAVLANGQTIHFNKACLATGSRPRRPPVAGATLGNIFYLRSLRDAQAVKEMSVLAGDIVIIGGGLIAVEAAAALREAKMKVTLMNRNQFLWQKRLDLETARWLTRYFELKGVTLMMQEDLNGFEGKTVLKNIQTKSGNRFPAGMVLVAVGAEPNIELVANTPLSSPNGTPVNEYLETDEKGVYAAGDIALFPDKIFGGVRRVDHWDCAHGQGAIAGANMTGKKRIRFDYMPYFFSEVFDLKFEFFGDFRLPPGRVECEGEHAKKKFVVRYFQGSKLTGIVHCNQDPALGRKAREEIRG